MYFSFHFSFHFRFTLYPFNTVLFVFCLFFSSLHYFHVIVLSRLFIVGIMERLVSGSISSRKWSRHGCGRRVVGRFLAVWAESGAKMKNWRLNWGIGLCSGFLRWCRCSRFSSTRPSQCGDWCSRFSGVRLCRQQQRLQLNVDMSGRFVG